MVERQSKLLEDTLGRGWLSLSLSTNEGAHSVTRPWSYNLRAWLLPVSLATILHLGMLWVVIGQNQGPAFPIAQTIRVSLVNLAKAKPETPAPAIEKAAEARVEPVEAVEAPLKKAVKKVAVCAGLSCRAGSYPLDACTGSL